MKYVLFLLLLGACCCNVDAQDTAKVVSTKLSTREKPRFPGGESELRKFLSLNLRYPSQALEGKVEGEVIVSFRIDEAGHVSEPVVLKGLGHGCDEEAIRVVKNMPDWVPARKNGKHVTVVYNLPIVFELPE